VSLNEEKVFNGVVFKPIFGLLVSQCGIVAKLNGEKVLQHTTEKGYVIVSLVRDGKKTSVSVHRLVALAWIPNPDNLSDVNHKDCVRNNNHVSNLEWLSHGDNIKYSYDTKRRSATGENNARAFTSEKTVIEICELLAAGYSAASIRDMGYNHGRVSSIKRRQNWKHISQNYIFP
jgi:hypothetical protein